MVWYDLIYFSVATYKEICFSILAFVFPIPRKNLFYDVAVVS